MKAKIISLLVLICLTAGTVTMTSCTYGWLDDYNDYKDSMNASSDTTESSADSTESSAETNNTEESTNQITNNTIQIDGTNNSIAYATASGLRSAVSIYCTFETTYGGTNPWNPTPSTQSYYTAGSGIIYRLEADGSAFIVTNHHVVYDSSSNTDNHISDKIYVYLYGLEDEAYAISAAYVGGSANYDIAVLRIDRSEILKEAIETGAAASVTVANSDRLTPGTTAIAIGNPSASDTDLGGISVTKGIVSVDSEYITMTASDNSGQVQFRVIRIDAPVNSGNSGGGLFNDEGELIGIVNAKISSSSVENIGYAIPSNVVRAIADNIIDYCYGKDCESVMRGILGITIEKSAFSTAYDTETGLFARYEEISVHEVTTGGLGESILKAGDVIKSITIGDKAVTVTRQHHLIDAMLDVRVGDTVSIVIVRDGTEQTVSAIITEDCLTEY